MKKSAVKIRALFILSFLLLLGGWYYTRQTLFQLSNVEVLTENTVVKGLILKQMATQLGRNLFALSLNDIELKLLSIKQIDDLVITKKWPSGIQIHPHLRTPVAILKKDKNEFFIDAKGVLFSEVSEDRGLWPLLENFEDDASLVKVVSWLGSEKNINQNLDISLRIQSLSWDRELGLQAKLTNGTLVELGFESYSSAWSRTLKSLEYLKQRDMRAAALDATYNSRVVVKAPSKLQNPKNDLNLKEIVHREGGRP
jgi:cell division septal protein FtsQ